MIDYELASCLDKQTNINENVKKNTNKTFTFQCCSRITKEVYKYE